MGLYPKFKVSYFSHFSHMDTTKKKNVNPFYDAICPYVINKHVKLKQKNDTTR